MMIGMKYDWVLLEEVGLVVGRRWRMGGGWVSVGRRRVVACCWCSV
jgi:hypothetical protein